jgi:hypothetical protein
MLVLLMTSVKIGRKVVTLRQRQTDRDREANIISFNCYNTKQQQSVLSVLSESTYCVSQSSAVFCAVFLLLLFCFLYVSVCLSAVWLSTLDSQLSTLNSQLSTLDSRLSTLDAIVEAI